MRAALRPLAALFVLAAVAATADAQVWGELSGRVTDAETGDGVAGASVLIEGTSFGTNTGGDGRYAFRIPEGTYPVRVSFVGYATVRDTLVVGRGGTTRFDAVLALAVGELGDVAVEGAAERGAGVSRIDPRVVRDMPMPMADALRGVKTELGVSSSNELSNSYSVRGGNYDENQFFIDGFEVYRPLRISQGEQEGLGLVNGDLTSRMTLFAGGFPVRYGGKLASVLDATYAAPDGRPRGTAYASTLDAGLQAGGALGENVGLAVAARSARPQRFFAGQELEGTYDPNFADVQGVADVALSDRQQLRVLGLYARHRFRLAPQQRETTFGIYPNLVRTVAVDFEGLEEDGYDIGFGGLLLTSRLSDTFTAEHRLSGFATDEFEGFGIQSRSTLFRREQRPEGSQTDLDRILEGQTVQRDSASNTIQQTIWTAQGRYLARVGRHGLDAGWQARALQFDDAINEVSRIDGRDADGDPVTITPRRLLADTTFASWQGALWVEDALGLGERLTLVPGVRADYFAYNQELTVSPRLGVLYQSGPQTTLSASFGVYHQAPTYRELRGDPAPGTSAFASLDGDIASPRSVQGVVGLDHFFTGRRLQLRAEAYAKRFSNLISYDVENVRVVYSAENDSEGYAYGADLQVRGELVPGLESWLTYGFLVTRERFFTPEAPGSGASQAALDAYEQDLARFAARGGGDWVARPTDRRHNLSLFVQDYIPGDDTWTLHIRTLYGTGVPTTPPARDEDNSLDAVSAFIDGPRNRIRLPSYFRFDLGATKELRVGTSPSGAPLELRATVEVLNVFDQTNTIAYSWVEQVSSGKRTFSAVPTRLTPRTLNVRFRVDF